MPGLDKQMSTRTQQVMFIFVHLLTKFKFIFNCVLDELMGTSIICQISALDYSPQELLQQFKRNKNNNNRKDL